MAVPMIFCKIHNTISELYLHSKYLYDDQLPSFCSGLISSADLKHYTVHLTFFGVVPKGHQDLKLSFVFFPFGVWWVLQNGSAFMQYILLLLLVAKPDPVGKKNFIDAMLSHNKVWNILLKS